MKRILTANSVKAQYKIYHTVNRLRSFLSSRHPVIWSSGYPVIWSSVHPVIRSSGYQVILVILVI